VNVGRGTARVDHRRPPTARPLSQRCDHQLEGQDLNLHLRRHRQKESTWRSKEDLEDTNAMSTRSSSMRGGEPGGDAYNRARIQHAMGEYFRDRKQHALCVL